MEAKILFVTNRNILTTCGELRLIKNRAETLYGVYEIPMDFIVLANSKRIHSEHKEKINAGGSITVIRQDIDKPVTIVSARNIFRKELKKRIVTGLYHTVIFSGVGMPRYAKYIRSIAPQIKVFVDVHGASEDIVEVAKDAPIKRRLFNQVLYLLDRYGFKSASDYLDGYFVVTEALREYVKQNFNPKINAQFYIVPCATISADDFYYDNYNKYREKYRARFGLNEINKVFIYSGGVSSWQCIEDTISLYKSIKREIAGSKLLVFSSNREMIKKIAGNDPDIIVDSFQPDELTKALCAGDFAFMLRKDCVTNNVAFPNKFLEYVQSKMKIISTPYVYEIAKQIKEYDIGYLYQMDNNMTDLIAYIKKSKTNSDKIVKEVLELNSFEVRLRKFSDYLGNV